MADFSVSLGQSDVCTTPVCKATAKSILEDINFNIDPCSDFYQFTCSSWIQNHKIPDDRSATGVLESALDATTEVMRDILEGGYANVYKNISSNIDDFHIDDPLDEANYDNMKQYYDVCMNITQIESTGPTPIHPDVLSIQDIFFPVFNVSELFAVQHIPQLTQTLMKLGLHQADTLFHMGVDVDDADPTTNVISLDQASLYLPSKEYYEDEGILEKYKAGLIQIIHQILGSEKAIWSTEKIESAVTHFIDIETSLSKITVKKEDLQDPVKNYNPHTLIELQEKYPRIDWIEYIKSFLQGDHTPPNKIIVRAPSYFESLDQLLPTLPLLKLQEFCIINFVLYKVYTLDEKSREVNRALNTEIFDGASAEIPRWMTCVGYTSAVFDNVMGRYYTLKKFGAELERKKAEEFLRTIHEAWLNKLPEMDWIDEKTKKKAYEKINLIQHKVGYSTVSPDLRKPSSLQTFYQGLYMNTTSFYHSESAISIWLVRRMWKKAGKPYDKDEWYMPAQTVNAYYSPNSNEIVIPAGILQSPMYGSYFPDYLNYGAIGMVIGHELTHAFDDSGRKFDGNGYLVDWWTNETSTRFEEKAQCFIDQYSKFNITSANKTIYVNGKLTLGENLADNGGLSASLLAYQKLRPNHDISEPKLPGLESLSPEALFFINFGRLWCHNERDKRSEQMIYIDEHSPPFARVNGVIQNSPSFAKAFSCPVGSPMNPEKKCQIW
ncbi:hypothetical protein BDB01DRAFT_808279 [Pilobolus umbonatus]|nr:hypothetical protein BDB01DRAFT_808279 [Pilobolus umbonatus]